MTALALGLAVFACTVAAISALTAAPGDRDSRRRRATRALTATALLVSVAVIALSKTGERQSSDEWQAAFLLALFALLFVPLTVACISSAPLRIPFLQTSCLESPRRWLSRAATWLSPIDTPAGFVRALLLWVVLPFVLVGATRWATGHTELLDLPADRLFTDILVTGAVVALAEEWLFRWPAAFAFRSHSLLLVLTVLWVALHPYEELLLRGTPAEAVLWALPGWCLSAVFYYKVWRGPFFWTAFIVHFSTNVGVIFVHNHLGVL